MPRVSETRVFGPVMPANVIKNWDTRTAYMATVLSYDGSDHKFGRSLGSIESNNLRQLDRLETIDPGRHYRGLLLHQSAFAKQEKLLYSFDPRNPVPIRELKPMVDQLNKDLSLLRNTCFIDTSGIQFTEARTALDILSTFWIDRLAFINRENIEGSICSFSEIAGAFQKAYPRFELRILSGADVAIGMYAGRLFSLADCLARNLLEISQPNAAQHIKEAITRKDEKHYYLEVSGTKDLSLTAGIDGFEIDGKYFIRTTENGIFLFNNLPPMMNVWYTTAIQKGTVHASSMPDQTARVNVILPSESAS